MKRPTVQPGAKLAELRASMAARGDGTPYSEIRAPLLDRTEKELFAPPVTREGLAAGRAADIVAIQVALTEAAGNVTRASAALGISRKLLRVQVARYGLTLWLRETFPTTAMPHGGARPRSPQKTSGPSAPKGS